MNSYLRMHVRMYIYEEREKKRAAVVTVDYVTIQRHFYIRAHKNR